MVRNKTLTESSSHALGQTGLNIASERCCINQGLPNGQSIMTLENIPLVKLVADKRTYQQNYIIALKMKM